MNAPNILLIPQPQKLTVQPGSFLLESLPLVRITQVGEDDRLIRKASSLFTVREIRTGSDGYSLTTLPASPPLAWVEGCDSYFLQIAQTGISLTAKTARGFFYGLVTIAKMHENYGGSMPCCTIRDWADIPMRSEYLDFRVVYPKFELLLRYIAELADYKINTLFLEYEDKLPFRELAFLQHSNHAFTPEQHQALLDAAEANFISVIPKQQCFGHLEYILRHPQYLHLRETPTDIAELCPSNPDSLVLISGILKELILLHPQAEYIHIGCDEVWSLGVCDVCKQSGKSKVELFISFVNQIIGQVCAHGKTPLLWHDMLAHATPAEIEGLDKRAVVCVWTYSGARARSEARRMIQLLQAHRITVFGAPSVRCWDGDGEQNYPNLPNRIRNVLEWVSLARENHMDCLINTNWAVPFALGSPYGIFETTRYPAFFAAEHCWNANADTEDYLPRYLLQYHGISVREENCDITDYFELAPELLPSATRNIAILRWMQCVLFYELYYKRKFPLHTYLARHDEEHFREEIKISLTTKADVAAIKLEQARQEMAAILNEFMPEDMAEFYIKTRFYLFSLYLQTLDQIYSRKGNSYAGHVGQTL